MQAALAASVLAFAAGGSIAAVVQDAASTIIGSPNGTSIPAATQIVDGSGHIWTVAGGVVYENGAKAGASANVTLLVYDDNHVYQETSAGTWFEWNGSAWILSSDPRKVASPNGMTVASASGGDIVSLSSGQCVSAAAGSTAAGTSIVQWPCGGVSQQVWSLAPIGNYYNVVSVGSGLCLNVSHGSTAQGDALIQWPCQTNGADNDQWSLVAVGDYYQIVSAYDGQCLNVDGNSQAEGAALIQWPCAPDTPNNDNDLWIMAAPAAQGQITDSSGNVWTVVGGIVYENGASAGKTANVTLLLYDNNKLYEETSAGAWSSWNGSTWIAGSNPRATPSSNGTTVPTATQITDASGNVWAVVGGVVYKNGALAGKTANVTLLLYYNSKLYEETSAGAWSSWNGSAWIAGTNPRATPSVNGTKVPTATQIIDSSGNDWTLVGGIVYENGALAGKTANVALLLYDNNKLYEETSAGAWSSWNGSTWIAGSNPRATPSSSGTTVPTATQITDSGGNIWTVAGGVVYENGAVAGKTANVTLLLYYNSKLYEETSAGAWSSWNGSAWIAGTNPRATPSVNGTKVPTATQIIDSSGDDWTLVGGIVYENGAPAGKTAKVTLLLYDNNKLYDETSAGAWSSWNGSAWIAASDPRATPSVTGTNVPTATEITDSSRNVWTVIGGVVYENGAPAGKTAKVTLLLYDNNKLYEETSAGAWSSWNGSAWIAGSNPRTTPSSNGTTVPTATQITDSGGNIWTVIGGVVYENGAFAGKTTNVSELLYDNGKIYQENSAGSWYAWSGSGWTAVSDPLKGTGTATLSWTAPTKDTDGKTLTDLAGYTIYYGNSSGSMTHTIKVSNPSTTTYKVTNLSAGTYYFSVAANASDGTQSARSAVGSKTIP